MGELAHSRWWDHIAPLLARVRVVALDLSGHGDSGRRETYSLDFWAREVLAVAADAGIAGPPTVIGTAWAVSSRSGWPACTGPGSPGRWPSIPRSATSLRKSRRPGNTARSGRCASIRPGKAAIARFRPIPDQPTLGYITSHVAETSVRAADGGWTWKFDPRIFGRSQLGAWLLTRLDCRVAFVPGRVRHSFRQMSEVMYDRLGRVAPLIEIPAAGHHVMLDQPIALIAALRTLLSDWDHSRPATA